MPSRRVTFDTAVINCDEDCEKKVRAELQRLREDNEKLSSKRFKVLAEEHFRTLRKSGSDLLNIHGGHRHGEETKGSASAAEAVVSVASALTPAQKAVGSRAADLILMLVQVYIMSSWFPEWYWEQAMADITSATRVLTFIGYGGVSSTSFVRHLTFRYFQLVGRCRGACRHFGTGAYKMGNKVLGRCCDSAPPPAPELDALYIAIKPLLTYLVAYHLGPEWAILINFQTFQNLCCEFRKWKENDHDDEHYCRRPGFEERAQEYMAWLTTFCQDWGLPMTKGTCRHSGHLPKLVLPDGTDGRTLQAMLDLFEAQVLRFSRLLKYRRTPVRRGAATIVHSDEFRHARINQFTWQLDAGSLATWTLVLRKLHPAVDQSRARDFDISWQGEATATHGDICGGGGAVGVGDHGLKWGVVLINVACSTSLAPVGHARGQVGWLTSADATPEALLGKVSQVALRWPFGPACDVDWRRPPLNVKENDEKTNQLIAAAAMPTSAPIGLQGLA
jgi:hypothetical protein